MNAAATTIKVLKQPTSTDWIDQAIANMDTILLDHSHCEKKAAGNALRLICRYPSHEKLVRQLTALAREELEHFDMVNQILQERRIPLKTLPPPPYGETLISNVRGEEPKRCLDFLLVSALIEARSHERLGLLGYHCPDEKLAKFYRGLMASEARHYGMFWLLAVESFSREEVDQRLDELATVESDILSTLHPQPRIHS